MEYIRNTKKLGGVGDVGDVGILGGVGEGDGQLRQYRQEKCIFVNLNGNPNHGHAGADRPNTTERIDNGN